jgi:hypothetical protein
MTGQRTNGSGPRAASAARACPNCAKPEVAEFRPFCSKRCADVDLHRWFSGAYAVPVREDAENDGTAPREGAPGESDDEPREQ